MNELIERGISFFDQGDFVKAIEVFTQAIEASPPSAEGYYHRGRSYYELKDYSHAEEDFKHALKLKPDYAKARAELSYVYIAKGDHTEGLLHMLGAIQKEPNNAYFLFKLAGIYHSCYSEHWKAAYYCSCAIEADPTYAESYSDRGRMYHMAGNYERALQDYRKYVGLAGDKADPNDIRYMQELEAQGGKDRITAPGFFGKLGDLYFQNRNYPQAVIEYTYWINSRPSPDGYSSRGMAYVLSGEYAKGLEDLNYALQHQPNNAEALTHRGLAFLALGNFEKALEDCNAAISLNSNDAYFYSNRGQVYRVMGQYARAFLDLTLAIKLNDRWAKPYIERGIVQSSVGKFDDALKDLSRGVELDPNEEQGHRALGAIYMGMEDKARALFHFEESVRLMGKNPDARIVQAVEDLKKQLGDKGI